LGIGDWGFGVGGGGAGPQTEKPHTPHPKNK